MRSISSTLEAAQKSDTSTPYVHIGIGNVNLTPRLLGIEHHEMPYTSNATIILDNSDRGLDDNDFRGEYFEVRYGYVTSAGNEGSDTPILQVKSQTYTSLEGRCLCILYAEGLWDVLAEKRAIILAEPPDDDIAYDREKTVYELIRLFIHAADYDLLALGGVDDGIIDDLKPYFFVNYFPYENIRSIIERLMDMTKCYLRAKEDYDFEVVYPHEDDAVDETYYSNQSYFFKEYNEVTNLLVPNKIIVYGNRDPDTGKWDPDCYGEAEDADQIAMNDAGEILHSYPAPYLLTSTDCENRAVALLTKFQSEMLAGRLIIQHDCRVELYDRVEIHDGRGK